MVIIIAQPPEFMALVARFNEIRNDANAAKAAAFARALDAYACAAGDISPSAANAFPFKKCRFGLRVQLRSWREKKK